MLRYKGLDAAAWLKRHKPDPRILRQLILDKDRPIIVLRTEESFATYLEGKASDRRPVIGPVIDKILQMKLDVQMIVSTRYGEQAPTLKRKFGGKIQVLDRIVDTTSLLSYSTMFIGSGGTMTVEAALLGKPAISCFPGTRTLYMKYLEKKRLMKTIHSPARIAREVSRTISSIGGVVEQGERGGRLLKWMEDPIPVVARAVEKAKHKC